MALSPRRVANMNLVRPYVPDPGNPKLSTWQLCRLSGLSYMACQLALRDLRAEGALHGQAPLIWRDGYGRTLDRHEVTRWYLWAMRRARGVIRNLIPVLEAYWAGRGLDAGQVHRRRRVFERILDTIEDEISDTEILA